MSKRPDHDDPLLRALRQLPGPAGPAEHLDTAILTAARRAVVKRRIGHWQPWLSAAAGLFVVFFAANLWQQERPQQASEILVPVEKPSAVGETLTSDAWETSEDTDAGQQRMVIEGGLRKDQTGAAKQQEETGLAASQRQSNAPESSGRVASDQSSQDRSTSDGPASAAGGASTRLEKSTVVPVVVVPATQPSAPAVAPTGAPVAVAPMPRTSVSTDEVPRIAQPSARPEPFPQDDRQSARAPELRDDATEIEQAEPEHAKVSRLAGRSAPTSAAPASTTALPPPAKLAAPAPAAAAAAIANGQLIDQGPTEEFSEAMDAPRSPVHLATEGDDVSVPVELLNASAATWIDYLRRLLADGHSDQVLQLLAEFRKQFPDSPLPDGLRELEQRPR